MTYSSKVVAAAVGLLVLGLVLCPRTPDGSRANPHEVLSSALAAEHTAEYSATQTHTFVFYGKTNRYETRVVQANGLRRVSLVDGDVILDQRDLPIPARRPGSAALIERNYIPLIEGEDTVSGRQTWVLRMKPRRKEYPWKQLWIDRKTWVVLAQREWSGRNELKSSMKTQTICCRSAGSIVEAARADCAGSAAARSASRPTRLPANLARPRYLPPGFELAGVEVEKDGRGALLTYNDGLYALSVFVSDADRKNGGSGQGPSDCGQATLFSAQAGGKRVTVVGDMPIDQMRRIARSVQ